MQVTCQLVLQLLTVILSVLFLSFLSQPKPQHQGENWYTMYLIGRLGRVMFLTQEDYLVVFLSGVTVKMLQSWGSLPKPWYTAEAWLPTPTAAHYGSGDCQLHGNPLSFLVWKGIQEATCSIPNPSNSTLENPLSATHVPSPTEALDGGHSVSRTQHPTWYHTSRETHSRLSPGRYW